MTQTQMQVNDAISSAFANLADTNQMLYDYWISELYDVENGDMIEEMWNENTLKLMENDVMQQVQVSDAYIMENDFDDSI